MFWGVRRQKSNKFKRSLKIARKRICRIEGEGWSTKAVEIFKNHHCRYVYEILLILMLIMLILSVLVNTKYIHCKDCMYNLVTLSSIYSILLLYYYYHYHKKKQHLNLLTYLTVFTINSQLLLLTYTYRTVLNHL